MSPCQALSLVSLETFSLITAWHNGLEDMGRIMANEPTFYVRQFVEMLRGEYHYINQNETLIEQED